MLDGQTVNATDVNCKSPFYAAVADAFNNDLGKFEVGV